MPPSTRINASGAPDGVLANTRLDSTARLFDVSNPKGEAPPLRPGMYGVAMVPVVAAMNALSALGPGNVSRRALIVETVIGSDPNGGIGMNWIANGAKTPAFCPRTKRPCPARL